MSLPLTLARLSLALSWQHTYNECEPLERVEVIVAYVHRQNPDGILFYDRKLPRVCDERADDEPNSDLRALPLYPGTNARVAGQLKLLPRLKKRRSPISGFGLFAGQRIAEGRKLTNYKSGATIYTEDAFAVRCVCARIAAASLSRPPSVAGSSRTRPHRSRVVPTLCGFDPLPPQGTHTAVPRGSSSWALDALSMARMRRA